MRDVKGDRGFDGGYDFVHGSLVRVSPEFAKLGGRRFRLDEIQDGGYGVTEFGDEPAIEGSTIDEETGCFHGGGLFHIPISCDLGCGD